jgi:hypothetical protein
VSGIGSQRGMVWPPFGRQIWPVQKCNVPDAR